MAQLSFTHAQGKYSQNDQLLGLAWLYLVRCSSKRAVALFEFSHAISLFTKSEVEIWSSSYLGGRYTEKWTFLGINIFSQEVFRRILAKFKGRNNAELTFARETFVKFPFNIFPFFELSKEQIRYFFVKIRVVNKLLEK